ncbi:fumarylacetoacetate hydrolase family protein [Burkholderia multivorans]|uniref:fumarylacetoacetate hydrolase family protein n=1 Tax=Burkholderia multivorans TaxID=87883 RepID=UPI001C213334|nr:fumarylacetoacetate hydrolase family protein [Burkholderia multivorans]MBU9477665.1 fumarylacetoacetate hydrolase family protein [Burkholderia multivorans]
MKFLTFKGESGPQLGLLLENDRVLNLSAAWSLWPGQGEVYRIPQHVGDLIGLGEAGIRRVEAIRDECPADCIVELSTIEFLAPIPKPAKNIFCVGRNYREHIVEGNLARGRDPNDFPKAVEFFTKAPTTVTGHRQPVKRHAHVTDFLDYEVELGVVIGKRGVDISRADAYNHVFGYTVVNDITARDRQLAHGQWFKGKSLDTTCPIGPYVVHRSAIPDPHKLSISLDVNGETRQKANTSSLLFSVPDVIAELSAGLTLEPGDVIATGTPSGVGLGLKPQKKLNVGDVVKARVEGIGELENRIVE